GRAFGAAVELARRGLDGGTRETRRRFGDGLRGELDRWTIAHGVFDVGPDSAAKVEAIKRQERVAVIGDELDGREDEFDLRLAAIVGQRDAHPTGLDAQQTARDLRAVQLARFGVDAEQAMAVGARARAPGAVLNSEKMIEQRGDEIVV